jgi:hypothetical protein
MSPNTYPSYNVLEILGGLFNKALQIRITIKGTHNTGRKRGRNRNKIRRAKKNDSKEAFKSKAKRVGEMTVNVL